MRTYMTSDETENDSVFTHSFYKSKNSEGTGDNSEGPVPAALGQQDQNLARVLGLTCHFGVVHCHGRAEFTGEYRLVYETDDPWEAMEQLEDCCNSIAADENCFLLLNETFRP